MPAGNEVGNDVWGFLVTVLVAAVGALINALRGWRGAESSDEVKKGGQIDDEKYRKVYIESAELADLSALRALPARLDRIVDQLQENHSIMKSVERIVDANHLIMTTIESVVKQNNLILTAVHDIRDALSNAEKVQEQVRLRLIEKQLQDRERERGPDR